jgi:hypothetical protein
VLGLLAINKAPITKDNKLTFNLVGGIDPTEDVDNDEVQPPILIDVPSSRHMSKPEAGED